MDNQELEDDTVRFIWNSTPRTKIQQARSVIHPAFHFCPLFNPSTIEMEYAPLSCSCQAAMNFLCPIDFNRKTIKCCICGLESQLPANYAQHIRPQKLPHQLLPKNSTFQFKMSDGAKSHYRQSYIFTVDQCISEQELNSIKQELVRVVQKLPDKVHVGLITYNKHICVYELASKLNMIYCINGTKEYKPTELLNIVGISAKAQNQFKSPQIIQRFIVPLQTHRQKIVSRIKDIKPDPNIYVNERNACALGQALNTAISIAEASFLLPRIIILAGGPCTVGPGMVISSNFKEQMRSMEDLNKGGESLKYFQQAKAYYDRLAKRVVAKKIIVDLFAFSLNELGLAEMSDLFTNSGGFVVMQEEFKGRIFKQSFHKIFYLDREAEDTMAIVTEATMQILCSKSVSINGVLGQCFSLAKMRPFVSDKPIGQGKTSFWHLGSLDSQKTLTFLYESRGAEANEEDFHIQLKVFFKNRVGNMICQVTTVKGEWTDRLQRIVSGFDQQAAAVLLGRLCVNKILYEEQRNVKQWLDSTLCRWAQYFANFLKNDENSFTLPEEMKKIPQFIYHLRRSHIVNSFGCSLDESYYYGMTMNRESVMNCMSIIQPVLLKYTLEELQPQPVQLEQEEMEDQVILLLDSYFVVIEWYGQNVNSWMENDFHNQPGYEHLQELFSAPKADITYILSNRFPSPNYYTVHPGHSKERYLKSKVIPKKSDMSQNQNMITDDSGLRAFTQHLIRVVVRHT